MDASSALRPLSGEEHSTALSRPYWDALQRGRLALQRCLRCGRFQHYPRTMCRFCHSTDLRFSAVSGRGVVFAASVVHRTTRRELEPRVPYILAVVRMDAGPLLMGLLAGVPAGQETAGREVAMDAAATRAAGLLSFAPRLAS